MSQSAQVHTLLVQQMDELLAYLSLALPTTRKDEASRAREELWLAARAGTDDMVSNCITEVEGLMKTLTDHWRKQVAQPGRANAVRHPRSANLDSLDAVLNPMLCLDLSARNEVARSSEALDYLVSCELEPEQHECLEGMQRTFSVVESVCDNIVAYGGAAPYRNKIMIDPRQRTAADIAESIELVTASFSWLAWCRRLEVQTSCPFGLSAHTDRTARTLYQIDLHVLRTALANILLNVTESCSNGGNLTVKGGINESDGPFPVLAVTVVGTSPEPLGWISSGASGASAASDDADDNTATARGRRFLRHTTAKCLLEAMGAHEMSTTGGMGTAFTSYYFELPMLAEESETPGAFAADRENGSGAGAAPTAKQFHRVVVISSNASSLSYFAGVFGRHAENVDTCETEAAAIQLICTSPTWKTGMSNLIVYDYRVESAVAPLPGLEVPLSPAPGRRVSVPRHAITIGGDVALTRVRDPDLDLFVETLSRDAPGTNELSPRMDTSGLFGHGVAAGRITALGSDEGIFKTCKALRGAALDATMILLFPTQAMVLREASRLQTIVDAIYVRPIGPFGVEQEIRDLPRKSLRMLLASGNPVYRPTSSMSSMQQLLGASEPVNHSPTPNIVGRSTFDHLEGSLGGSAACSTVTPSTQSTQGMGTSAAFNGNSPVSLRTSGDRRGSQTASSLIDIAESAAAPARPPSVIPALPLQPWDMDGSAGDQLRVLCVDDNPVNLKVIGRHLQSLECSVTLKNNGEDAVEAWRTGDFHLIVSDIMMPGMSGHDVSRAIRALEKGDPPRGRIPIVALTANALQSNVDACKDAGMDDFMTKPVIHKVLHGMLIKWAPMGTRFKQGTVSTPSSVCSHASQASAYAKPGTTGTGLPPRDAVSRFQDSRSVRSGSGSSAHSLGIKADIMAPSSGPSSVESKPSPTGEPQTSWIEPNSPQGKPRNAAGVAAAVRRPIKMVVPPSSVKSVLVCDGNQTDVMIITRLLKVVDASIKLKTVSRTPELLKQLEKEPFECLIIDERTGHESVQSVCEEVRRIEKIQSRYPATIIVLLDIPLPDRLALLESHAAIDVVLSKPVSLPNLSPAIRVREPSTDTSTRTADDTPRNLGATPQASQAFAYAMMDTIGSAHREELWLATPAASMIQTPGPLGAPGCEGAFGFQLPDETYRIEEQESDSAQGSRRASTGDEEAATATEAGAGASAASGGSQGHRILVVSQPMQGKLLVRNLNKHGYNVVDHCDAPDAALTVIRDNGGPAAYRAMFLDTTMCKGSATFMVFILSRDGTWPLLFSMSGDAGFCLDALPTPPTPAAIAAFLAKHGMASDPP